MMDFREACQYVGLDPTKRQERKFRRKMGLAYRAARGDFTVPILEISQGARKRLAIRAVQTLDATPRNPEGR